MDRKKIYLTLEEYERNIIFTALNEMRNAMIAESRPTDPVGDLMIKVDSAGGKRSRAAEGNALEEYR